jgi:multiple sugar transport system substrate-binding protein/putative aldouronate transport system substrate-binding protein
MKFVCDSVSECYKNDPKANWQAYPVYTDDGKWNIHMKAPGVQAEIMSKKASPDAIAAMMIMNNHLVAQEMPMQQATDEAIGWYPLRCVEAAADECEHEYAELTKVLDGKADPESYNDPKSIYKNLYVDAKNIKATIPGYKSGKELATTDFDESKWNFFSRDIAIMVGDRPYATVKPSKEVYSVTYSTSDMLEQRWPNLWKMEQQVMMSIITGKSDISAFDKFVTDWKSQGGDQVLKDVASNYLGK